MCTDTVVLDHRENSGCNTGDFELIYQDSTNSNSRGIDCKLLLEGQKIKKLDLQRYTLIDQKAMKVQKEKEARAKERQEKEKRVKEEHQTTFKTEDLNVDDSSAAATMDNEIFASRDTSETCQTAPSSPQGDCVDELSEDEMEQLNKEQLDLLASFQENNRSNGGDKSKEAYKDRYSKPSPNLRSSIIEIYGGKDRQTSTGGAGASKGKPAAMAAATKTTRDKS